MSDCSCYDMQVCREKRKMRDFYEPSFSFRIHLNKIVPSWATINLNSALISRKVQGS
jgi:hypothetical protein